MQISVSLFTRRRCFLDTHEWRTLPWAGPASAFKDGQSKLCDILAGLPGLLEEETNVEMTGDKDRKLSLVSSVYDRLRALFQWRWEWERANPNVVWEVELANAQKPQLIFPERPISKMLYFSSFAAAAEISLYNAILLCLLGMLLTHQPRPQAARAIEQLIGKRIGSGINSLLQLPKTMPSIHAAAVEILRAFEFQLTTVTRDCSSLYWLFPIGLANQVLAGDAAYSTWLQHLLGLSHSTRAYGKGESAFGMVFYKTLQAFKASDKES